VLHGRKPRDTFVVGSCFCFYLHELFLGVFLLEFLPSRFVRFTVRATNHIKQNKNRTISKSLLGVLFLGSTCELLDRHLYE
jgi:hypothetical protein